jgi:hypothetical protein
LYSQLNGHSQESGRADPDPEGLAGQEAAVVDGPRGSGEPAGHAEVDQSEKPQRQRGHVRIH